MHGRPLLHPFPKVRAAEGEQANARHNPMPPRRRQSRLAEYQPQEPRRSPRSIPDQAFSELFAGLASHRDRALVAFCISTAARVSELLASFAQPDTFPTWRPKFLP
ncbi:hypothetical protein [Streptomyces inhibens]|uniref:hypothetical protein n=1 Tax=Streptomyces inhibens TaxID=2293571 RepID=UPI001EE77322|nr:hypothetical protein [Streptomyces inhibens]UKY47975.1 hypothetical protein KI385_03530 [Streptomyces inhibens]